MPTKKEWTHWKRVRLACGCEFSYGPKALEKYTNAPKDERLMKCPEHKSWQTFEVMEG